MSELKNFRLPDVGEGLTEADIVRWHVKPGDQISINQIIVEIETAKAVVELPSPYAGVVSNLLVPEGATADVGTPIISVDVGGNGGAPAAPATPEPIAGAPREGAVEPGIVGSPAPKAERQAVLVGYGVKLGTTARRARKQSPQAAQATAGQPVAPAPSAPARIAPERTGPAPTAAPAGILAKPPVRKLAKDLGVDLASLVGTGKDGTITRDDVHLAAAGPDVAMAAPAPAAGVRDERIPIRGVRRHMAAAMTASAFTAPHVTEFLQIDMTAAMEATARLRQVPDFDGVRVSPLLLVAKALLIAVGRHPLVNSSWDESAQEIVVHHYVNLGIAAATERGLVVPTVKDAHAMSLPRLAAGIASLTDKARAGKSSPADLSGGTITITNVGVFGVDGGTPIISPGEAAILAFGQVKDAPWVYEGQLAVRKVCTLSLSFDHRIIDGELGSALLRDVGAMLTDPLRMLAWS
ncbi:MAG TPA: dihydrolipoamide acetyltransferase family protein [Streptosporangiaceae bacterium]|nr:dihydrolipoamide acetyltransferase family protein [Streptosporangiaceae bacterium]